MRTVLREAAVFALFLVLAVALTWPLARDLSTAVSDFGDPLLIAWTLDWVCYALLHAPLDLYDARIFHPAKYPLAFSEHEVGTAILVLPLHLAGVRPIAMHNVALLLAFALSGYGGFVLVRLVTGAALPSILAGVFLAFNSLKMDHVAHVHIVNTGWLALMFAALFVFWRRPDKTRAALLAGAFFLNGLTNTYWLLFGGFTLVVTILFLCVFDRRPGRELTRRLATALVIGGLALVPFLLPYRVVAETYGMRRNSDDAKGGSATWTDWLVAPSANLAYGKLPDEELSRNERRLFPGLLVLFLAAYAALTAKPLTSARPEPAPTKPARERTLRILDALLILCTILFFITASAERIAIGRFAFSGSDVPAMLAVVIAVVRLTMRFPSAFGEDRSLRTMIAASRFTPWEWAAAIWIVIGFIGSFGESSFLQPFLFRLFEPFRATRTPSRWAVIAYLGIAIWAAKGAAALLARRRGFARHGVAALLLAVAIAEVVPRIPWQHVEGGVAPVYRWLARARPRAAIELPIAWDMNEIRYVFAATAHRVPIFNGVSAFRPPLHEELSSRSAALAFDDAFTDILIRNGCDTVIVHLHLLDRQTEAVRSWLDRETKRGRFWLVERFEHDGGEDLVFTVIAGSG